MLSVTEVVTNAHIFNFNNWQQSRMDIENLLKAIPQLFDLLTQRKIDYLLVGGVAILHYVDGRNTEDIDLVMRPDDLEALPELEIVDRNDYFVRAQFDALQVDILLTENDLFADVLSNYAVEQEFQEQSIRCATVDGLMLLKLYALPSLYRQGKFERVALYESDIARLMNQYEPDLRPIWEKLPRHMSESDMQEIKEIVADIEKRIARFRRGIDT